MLDNGLGIILLWEASPDADNQGQENLRIDRK